MATAGLDGPYSLSGTMHDLMLEADDSFPAPYFMPYTIAGYGAANPTTPELQFSNAIISSPSTFAPQLFKLLDGSSTAGQISAFMATAPDYNGPITITSQNFQTLLKTPGSVLNQALAANDGYNGWQPTIQLRMFHLYWDDLVPVENSYNASTAWQNVSKVSYVEFYEYIPFLGIPEHAGAIVPAYIRGVSWLSGIAGVSSPTAWPGN